MSLKARFEQTEDRIEALSKQQIVADREVATALAQEGELLEFAPGRNIIEQGASDRDIHFILAGKGHVIINQARLYPRERGVAVGEMSAINPAIGRAATIEATDPTVTWKVSHT